MATRAMCRFREARAAPAATAPTVSAAAKPQVAASLLWPQTIRGEGGDAGAAGALATVSVASPAAVLSVPSLDVAASTSARKRASLWKRPLAQWGRAVLALLSQSVSVAGSAGCCLGGTVVDELKSRRI